jgi:hypothetical protein
MKQLFVFASLFFFGSLVMHGQDTINDILDKLPAKTTVQQAHLMQQLSDAGAPAVLTLVKRLVPPRAQAVDVKERYALSGLAKYLGKSSENNQRQVIEAAFTDALNLGLDIEVEVFIIEQLQFFATSKSIEQLIDKATLLCEPAVNTISQIGTPEALQALIALSGSTQGYCLEVVTKAIAGFDLPLATDALLSMASSSDNDLVKTMALSALATSGRDGTYDLISSFAQSHRSVGNDLLLDLAETQAAKGNVKNLQPVIDQVTNTGTESQKGRAMKLIANYSGASAKKVLLKALKNGPESSILVANALKSEKSVPLAPYFKMIKKVDNQTKIALLEAAKARDYKPAATVAKTYLTSDDPMLQISAIQTLSHLEGKSSLSSLQNVLITAKDDRVLKVGAQEFSHWISKDNLDLMVTTLQKSSGKNKANLIDLIAERKMASIWPQIEPLLEDGDAMVRARAFAAIPRLTESASVTDLIALVSIARTDAEMATLEQAFALKASKSEDKSTIVDPLIDAFGTSNPTLLGHVFPFIGGPKALEFVSNSSDRSALIDWKSPDATPRLFSFIGTPNEAEAISSILRLTNHPDMPRDQQVLYLRKLMPLVNTIEDKKRVIQSLSNTKSHTAFIFLKNLITEKDLQLDVANALVRLALPDRGETVGLIGQDIRDGLMMADTILKGTEDEYTQAFLHNYLNAMPEKGGFVSMFNGTDLQGWQGLVENPIARDTMFRTVLRAKQIEADEKLKDNWKVEDGKIVFFGEGYQNLCSVKSYRDFELLVDWKISKGGDSGIYLRGTPQVQIWDTSLVQEGAQVGSGGLYNNQEHESKPLVVADNATGEWNTLRIIMIQDKVSVYLNGVLVTDNVVLENYWNRALPLFREGPIELQAHGTNLQFRDIYVREIESAPELPEIERNMGFVQLFNGVNLDGWVGNKTDYVVENGEIVIYPGGSGGSGNLFTEKEYENFTFSFEFKLTPGANNGLGIHAPLEGDAAYLGKEIQILDNDAPIYDSLHDYQYHGSIYGLVPAEKGALKPIGEWNREEVSVKGNQIRVVLNGQRIVSADLNVATRNGTLDGKDHPGLKKLKGHIGFLGHGSEVYFRNIRIREDTE